MQNRLKGLKYFFEPKSIAIIGASSDAGKPGGKPMRALLKKNYTGIIYPVNPKYEMILDLKCYPSLKEIPGEVDLAIISLPAESVYAALEQCIEKGVKAAVIFSSGFAETGPEGRLAQERITRLAKESGILLCGPNCLGVINTNNGVMASFALIVDIPDVEPRSLGFVTQSGAFGELTYAQALYNGIGLNYFVSVGNEADLEFSDFLQYMLHDQSTKVVGGYLEGAKDGEKLRRAAEEALNLEKPVMIIKSGRSTAGARAASSHTGSLAGSDQVYNAFFKQTGIIRINASEELISFVPLMEAGRLPRGRNVALLTASGGEGVTLADLCEGLGLVVPHLDERTRSKIGKSLPSFASVENPIDLTGQYLTNPEMLMVCLNALLEDEKIDIIIGNFSLQEPELARKVIEAYRSTDKVIVICPRVIPGTDESDGVRELRKSGLPIILNSAHAVRATAQLADYAEFMRKKKKKEYHVQHAVKANNSIEITGFQGILSESQSKEILTRYEIPITRQGLASTIDDAVALAGQIGYPVALKVDSPDIPHKTESGGVILNLNSDQEVIDAYEKIIKNIGLYMPDARLNGVLVQEMILDGIEVIIGVHKDPVFGPVIMFGLGGIFVEVLKDVSFRVAPISHGDAMDMIKETKGYQLLKGVRGKPPVDIDALVDVIMKVSTLVTDLKDYIEELDINPLLVFPGKTGAKALDAMIVLKK